MAPPIPTCEPTQFVAGDTVMWNRSIADYPATDGWTLKYAFRGVGKIDVTAAPVGATYAIVIPSTGTGSTAVTPGLYEWTAWVENTASPIERHTIGSGRVVIQPQLAAVTDASRQQHAERMVSLLETQLEQLAASPIETYSIEQQQTIRRKMKETKDMRSQYLAELRRLRSRGRPRSYAVVFRG